jgi:SET domain-containing protein
MGNQMAIPTHRPRIGVRDYDEKGRGLCAATAFRAGELIESAPVLVLGHDERLKVAGTRLKHYYFHWEDEPHGQWSAAIALGLISLCNHSSFPNARFVPSIERECIDLIAHRDIEEGDEITIDYDCDLWFEIKD